MTEFSLKNSCILRWHQTTYMTAKPSKRQRHPKLTFAEQPTWATFLVAPAFNFQKSHSAVASPGNNFLLQIHIVLLDTVVTMTLITDDLVSNFFLLFLSLRYHFWGSFLIRGFLFALCLPNSTLGLTIPSGSPSAHTGETLPHSHDNFSTSTLLSTDVGGLRTGSHKKWKFHLVYTGQTSSFYSTFPVAKNESMQASKKSMIPPFLKTDRFLLIISPLKKKYKQTRRGEAGIWGSVLPMR